MRPLLLLPALLLFSFVQAGDPPDVIIRSGNGMKVIGQQVELLVDGSARLSFEEVRHSTEFKPSASAIPNLGIGNAAHWFRFRAVNQTTNDRHALSIGNAEIAGIDAWVIGSDGTVEHHAIGQGVDQRTVAEPDIEPIVPLHIPTGGSVDVYMRFTSDKQLVVPLAIGTKDDLRGYASGRDLLIGCYLGFMAVLLLYNLFVFLSTRDRYYLIYVAYILLVSITQAVFIGFAKFRFWPESSWFATQASVIFTVITAVSANEFMTAFIQVRKYEPRLARFRFLLYALMAVGVVARLTHYPIEGYQLLQLLVMVSAVYQFVVAFRISRRGSRVARYFLVAWCMFLAGIVIFVLKDVELLPYNDFTKYTMPIGTAFEGIMLSLALADRINVLRREKERSQAEALATSLENQRIIREQNVILEEKVTERTHALRESNEHLKRTQTQLVNAEKMASLGQLTAGIAHEINNPINFITSNIQPLRRNISEIVEVMQEYRALTPETAAEKLKALKEHERKLGISDSIDELDDIIGSISEGSNRTAEIVRGLRNFSRLDEDDLKEADLHEGLRNTLALLAPQYRDKVNIRFNAGAIPTVECFAGKVNQVFMNVLTNAIQATAARTDGTTPEVVISTITEDGEVCITIADNGIGMSDEVKARMFEPFFTTKPVGEGTGLGLAIVYGIIEDHHGRIEVTSEAGKGTSISIILPIRHAALKQQRA
ncbi:MAG: GHKL domain-containing protein [Flavobacteriales bacterium]|nr:GHKL domain-containing protein [Flavobacteriales bacterium]